MLVVIQEGFPTAKIRLFFSHGHAELLQHDEIQLFFHEQQRDIVNRIRVDALYHRIWGDVTETCNLGAH